MLWGPDFFFLSCKLLTRQDTTRTKDPQTGLETTVERPYCGPRDGGLLVLTPFP